jgi:AraC-like DNA-binding protein
MDPLAHFLDGPRARRAFALRVVMNPGWSIDVRDRAPLTVLAVLSGHAIVVTESGAHDLSPGGVAVIRGPATYTVTDDASRPADVIIHPGQVCSTPSGADLAQSMSRGIGSWGNSSDGETVLLLGTYETDSELGSAVRAALPQVAAVPAGDIDPGLLRLLEAEVTNDAIGGASMVDRLLDVVLVHAVRAWTQARPEAASGWLAGGADPLVAEALRHFHESPAKSWTLASLSAQLGVSRATIASRFRRTVGEPPMAYLTRWRMLLTSELLADRRQTIAAIADEVGYGSAFALSTAFKRRFGVSPNAYRARDVGGGRTAAPPPRKLGDVATLP